MIDILFFQPALINKEGVSFSAISEGLIALSLYLRDKGYTTKICHFDDCGKGLENFVKEKIKLYNPKNVGINLTWHVHCYQALKIAETVKEVDSNTKTILGGFTASFFDKEIFEYIQQDSNRSYLDVIIRGDAEEPLTEFIKTRKPDRNASYLKNGKFVRNPLSYTQKTLPSVRLKWSLNDLVDDWGIYLNKRGIRTSALGIERKVGHSISQGEFHLYIGKGCRNDCCYCGGGREVHKLLFNRKKPLFRPTKDVEYDINQLAENGIKTIYIDFDPDSKREYFKKLFSKLGKQNLNLMFSAWCGPIDNRLLDVWKNIFNNVEIVISPETGSEKLRKELLEKGHGKPPFYTNKKLLNFLDEIKKRKFKAMVYFISGLPWETEEDFQETLELGKKLSRDYSEIFIKPYDQIVNRNLCSPPLYIEPASPIYRTPNKFSMCLNRNSFEKYLQNSKNPKDTSLLGVYNKKFGSEINVISNTKKFNKIISN